MRSDSDIKIEEAFRRSAAINAARVTVEAIGGDARSS